jgi:hypothetical protein
MSTAEGHSFKQRPAVEQYGFGQEFHLPLPAKFLEVHGLPGAESDRCLPKNAA